MLTLKVKKIKVYFLVLVSAGVSEMSQGYPAKVHVELYFKRIIILANHTHTCTHTFISVPER